VIARGKCVSRDHNLSIVLQSHAICGIGGASDLGRDLPRFAKVRVECAIRVVSQHSEFGAVFPAGLKGITGDNNFPIALQRHSLAFAITVTDGGNDFASTVEAFVQASIHIVTYQRDVVGTSDGGVSRDHNLSIALHRHTLAVVITICGDGGMNEDHGRNARAPGEGEKYFTFESSVTTLLRHVSYPHSAIIRSLCRSKSNY